ncbi:hypothetical protein L228DRAFT_243272 [Xylona heveae TC161]|uniref:Uncharacterized protein n=1 Tax=Xylona heveae (strain CBS 132557 / TC161) TaxID=1328760 RepID=A0A165JXP8_XYLHT|nr:hypothetical protein L228DRAFT_243272 [Xylona heveae TC161]KZF26757.1 hypothetical protein L228DRAFT_243272 [Xylona heveae TC161]
MCVRRAGQFCWDQLSPHLQRNAKPSKLGVLGVRLFCIEIGATSVIFILGYGKPS